MTTDLSDDDLVRLKELAEKATKGPWHSAYDIIYLNPPSHKAVVPEKVDGQQRVVDAAFIAACDPQTILSLLSHIEQLGSEVARLTRAANANNDFWLGWNVPAQQAALDAEVGSTTVRALLREHEEDHGTTQLYFPRGAIIAKAIQAALDVMKRQAAERPGSAESRLAEVTEALRGYATTFCEGYCGGDPTQAVWSEDECSGCKARRTIGALSSTPATPS